MKRRNFMKLAGISTISPFLFPQSTPAVFLPETEDRFVLSLVKANDSLIPDLLKRQNANSPPIEVGGIPDHFGIYTAGGTARFIEILACAYLHPTSIYYQSSDLVEPMSLASHYMVETQYEDGTIDLHTTNFHSTPDTGFVLEHICSTYGIFLKAADFPKPDFQKNMEIFIKKGGDALSVGGIHTPNHRWVVCRALARINSFFPKKKYMDRINEWLDEKIDIDPDGQFTEKSSSIYSPLTDRCLITIARLTGKTGLYDPVRKNLEITMYYVHPDGEVVTEASRRQDKYRKGSMAPYYYPYRYMSLLDNNGQFAEMTHWIQKTAGDNLVNNLIYYIEDPSLQKKLPSSSPLPVNYFKEFSYSQLVRIRRQEISATILAQNTSFFSFHKGVAALEGLRFATAFFGKGQFQGKELEKKDAGYLLHQDLKGPYYQPFPRDLLPDDGDWHKMNRAQRPHSEIQLQEATVFIKEKDGKFEITIEIKGTDNVPLAIEFGFRKGGTLSGVREIEEIPQVYILESGMGKYTFKGKTIWFGTGQANHTWTQLRGARPKLDAMSVYITGFTPFKKTIQIY